jgi:copper chaperone CopZ
MNAKGKQIMRNSLFGLVIVCLVGCSEQAKQEPVATNAIKPASFNTEGAPTIEFTVPDMMCPEGCGEKVKEILSEQPGAKDVLVEFETKTVKVAVDKDKFDSTKAVAALKDHQFGHSALKDLDAASPPAAPQPEKTPVAN